MRYSIEQVNVGYFTKKKKLITHLNFLLKEERQKEYKYRSYISRTFDCNWRMGNWYMVL